MADLADEQGSPMASHDAAPEFAQNVFLVVWRDGGDDDPLMVVHRRGKFCQGRKIGRRLEDSADLSTSDCLEFYGPGSKQARPGATDAGGTTKPGLWCITAVFRQWDDGESIEQAISLTKGGPAPKWRRMAQDELVAFAKGGVSKKIEAWLLGPTQALWDGSLTGDYLLAADAPEPEPHVCTGCIGDGPCEAEHEEPSVSVDDVDAADAYDEDRQEGERVR